MFFSERKPLQIIVTVFVIVPVTKPSVSRELKALPNRGNHSGLMFFDHHWPRKDTYRRLRRLYFQRQYPL